MKKNFIYIGNKRYSLTPEEISKMPAGKEIDEIIYKKVVDIEYQPGEYVPEYSTEIAAAWQVIEKFENHCMLNNVHGIWECYFPDNVKGEGETAPLAICRAALLSLME